MEDMEAVERCRDQFSEVQCHGYDERIQFEQMGRKIVRARGRRRQLVGSQVRVPPCCREGAVVVDMEDVLLRP